MKRTTDLDRYDRLAARVAARRQEAQRHYDELHALRMTLDRATPIQTTELASQVARVASYVHDESLLLKLLEPFIRDTEEERLDQVRALLPKIEDARNSLHVNGVGPIMMRAFRAAYSTRQESPQVPQSIYETLGRGGLRLTPQDLAELPATEEERSQFYRELLVYESLVEEKGQAISALETALAASVLERNDE